MTKLQKTSGEIQLINENAIAHAELVAEKVAHYPGSDEWFTIVDGMTGQPKFGSVLHITVVGGETLTLIKNNYDDESWDDAIISLEGN